MRMYYKSLLRDVCAHPFRSFLIPVSVETYNFSSKIQSSGDYFRRRLLIIIITYNSSFSTRIIHIRLLTKQFYSVYTVVKSEKKYVQKRLQSDIL